jgi:hypothetical protein
MIDLLMESDDCVVKGNKDCAAHETDHCAPHRNVSFVTHLNHNCAVPMRGNDHGLNCCAPHREKGCALLMSYWNMKPDDCSW